MEKSKVCRKEYQRKYYLANRDKILSIMREQGRNRGKYAQNPDYYKRKKREMSQQQRDKHNARCRDYQKVKAEIKRLCSISCL